MTTPTPTRTVTCADCGQVLDEDSRLLTRPPCPRCGSTTRTVPASSSATLTFRAKSDGIRWREYVERNWWWMAALAVLGIGGALAGWLVSGWLALVIALALVPLRFLVGQRASTRVRDYRD